MESNRKNIRGYRANKANSSSIHAESEDLERTWKWYTRKNVRAATPQVFVELAINVGGQRIARSRHRLGELGVMVLDGPLDTAIFKA